MVKPGRSKRTVVVVDDEEGVRFSVSEVLRDEGYEVITFGDGRSALDHLRAAPAPDLIMLDLRMPVMDGWQFRVEQKKNPATAGTPVIAMSADGSAQAAAIDADFYLRKPFDVEAMLGAVGRIITAAEQERIQARLDQAERMASLGVLAAGVAHEINNPLAYVGGNLEFISAELSALDAAREDARFAEILRAAREALEGVERVRRIVRDLRTLSRTEHEERRPVDIRRVIEFAATVTRAELRQRARVVRELAPVPLVLADEARLGQVFINLLVNAAQALPEGQAEKHEVRLSTSTDGDGRVVVLVTDTGSGIPPEVLPRIFEPFFTTKPVGVGTGLGLSICHGIVTGLGGELSAHSELGRGATLRVVLPAAAIEARPAPEAPAAAPRRGKILVIDDDPLIGSALRRTLGSEHDVQIAASVRDALAKLAEVAFDVIVCDLMMPLETGMDFYDALSQSAPATLERVVFLTGGASDARTQAFLDRVPNDRIEKPFDVKRLRALIRERVG